MEKNMLRLSKLIYSHRLHPSQHPSPIYMPNKVTYKQSLNVKTFWVFRLRFLEKVELIAQKIIISN